MAVPIITIDGPSGAGKGTVCRRVALATGYQLLDSGSLYRISALACINNVVDINSESEVERVVEGLSVQFKIDDGETFIFLSGEDVTSLIRDEQVGMAASKIAAYPSVRRALLEQQRRFAVLPGLVADGRDMGTVVFPNAQIKIYLTASAEERARRRLKQLDLASPGKYTHENDYEKILRDIRARDEQDMSRATAPLKPAGDALVIDSTDLSIDEVVSRILNQVPSVE